MPRGESPNSRKALEAGKRDFSAETAREAGRKGATSPKRKTTRLFREILADAMKKSLKDEAVVETLKSRGMLADGEEIDVKTAITYIRLIREIENPTPDGFDRLMKAIGEENVEGNDESARIEMDVPKEFRV